MYEISKMTVKATPEEIEQAYEGVFLKREDYSGEYAYCLKYLPLECALSHLARILLKSLPTEKTWIPRDDASLTKQLNHCREHWPIAIRRGYSIPADQLKDQFTILMMLAGLPEWKELWEMQPPREEPPDYRLMSELEIRDEKNRAWQREDVWRRSTWNFVAELFGFEKLSKGRQES